MLRIALALLLTAAACAADTPAPIAQALAARRDALAAVAAADVKLGEAYLAWLRTANLDPLPVPTLGDDPRASDVTRHADIQRINLELSSLRSTRAATTDPRVAAHYAVDCPEMLGAAMSAEAIRAGDRLSGAEAPAAKPHHAPAGGITPAAR